MPLIPAQAYRPVTVREHTYWCFTLAVRIPGLGKVRIVVSFEHESMTGRSVVLVTNRVDWSAAKIIDLYLQRWPTETFYQDSKGQLGFNEYRMRSAEAIGKHWCLVFVAYSLLHLTCLPARPDRTQSLIQTIGTPVGSRGVRCCRSCWCSSMTSCPRAARLTKSSLGCLPNRGAWFPPDHMGSPQNTTVEEVIKMNTMRMPGFSAEASFYRSTAQYQGGAMLPSFGQGGERLVHPALKCRRLIEGEACCHTWFRDTFFETTCCWSPWNTVCV